jgi:phosphoglycerate dehydrogenase-like enzyme
MSGRVRREGRIGVLCAWPKCGRPGRKGGMERVLLDLFGLPEGVCRRLEALDATLRIVHGKHGERAVDDELPRAQIIIGWPAKADLERATELRWLQLPSAGADGYAGKMPGGVILTSARGVFGVPIAEHVLAMMFALAIRLPEMVLDQAQKRWHRPQGKRELLGATCMVIGLGDIGSEVAKRARALGMHVIGVKRTVSAMPAFVDELATLGALDGLLARADHVVLALPGTTHTRHVISRQRIALMKPGACIYNVGRGSAIDQQAMVEALSSGRLGGAGLDVFDPEPLPADSPLWAMPNVIVTPHFSGHSPNQARRFGELMERNYQHFLAGEALVNQVDSHWGY